MLVDVYIGLGSNLNTPIEQLSQALKAMRMMPQTELVTCSHAYASQPLGPQDQPDYVNAVAHLTTALLPEDLLAELQAIEQNQGRERKSERWGPRTLDLDILLYGDLSINTNTLTIPHYHMREREFVLYPLAEIAPDLILPCGTTLQSILETCPKRGLTRIGKLINE